MPTPQILLELGSCPSGGLRADQLPAAGLDLVWEECDAEAVPYLDASFDAVISAVGVMFAPYHQASADELVRVCRPGGTPHRSGQLDSGRTYRAAVRSAAALRPAAQPPPLWGSEDHVRRLFGDTVTNLVTERRQHLVDRFTTSNGFRDFFKAPTVP
jgi:ubiquinone/menaquinone biosynthesis C-methylase UbiE